jgi:predicted DCC family thiol-disulfide oxidoreductase YuxK
MISWNVMRLHTTARVSFGPMSWIMTTEPARPVVFFDGVCNLCNGAVQFILDRDARAQFRFAPLQSEAAEKILVAPGLAREREARDSIILVEGDKVYRRSGAVLRIARRLGAPWSAAYVFILVPRFVRDAVYKVIARNRYRWFGRTEQCRVPTPELRARFLT